MAREAVILLSGGLDSTTALAMARHQGFACRTLTIDYPGRHLSRTILQGNVEVPIADLGVSEIGTHSSYDLMLNGEILREGKLFENFRYKYDFPTKELGGTDRLPLVFQRYLRPGPVSIMLKVEDLFARRFARVEKTFEVQRVDQAADVLFGLVFDGRLDVDEAAAFPLQPVAGKAQGRDDLPGRMIEKADVVHHRQVALMIAMPGIDRPAVSLDHAPHGAGPPLLSLVFGPPV